MRSKWLLLIMVAGCYKATGPETCEPVPTSWAAPIERCTVPPVMQPSMVPEGKPQPRVEVTTEQIKLREKVEFETDSAKLLPASTPILDEVVEVMKAHPEIEHVRVGGHTDSTATTEHNMKLSDERAASVKQYLVDHGIAPERLSSKGYGETRPIADNGTEEGRSDNRRVEIHIMRHKGDAKDREDK